MAERVLLMNACQGGLTITSIERIGYALLETLDVPFLPQEPFMGRFVPDTTLPDHDLLVQFDGDYWHDRAGTSREPRIKRRVALDLSQDAYARSKGWEVLRFWEGDLRADPMGCLAVMADTLDLPVPEDARETYEQAMVSVTQRVLAVIAERVPGP